MRHVVGSAVCLGMAFAVLFLMPLVVPDFLKGRPAQPLDVNGAFRQAWRDSFGTDVTGNLAKVIVVDHIHHDLKHSIEDNGFVCTKSELNNITSHHICTDFAWSFHDILPKREKWVVEILCTSRGPSCKVKQVFASISNR